MAIPLRADVLIVGAGVSGLTTGICLAEAGLSVRLVAERPPQQTTSAVAGASWGPYMSSDSRVLDWSLRTHRELSAMFGEPEENGIRFVDGMDASAEPMEPPDWARDMPGFELEPNPPADYVVAWRYTNVLVDMPRYLVCLERRLTEAGGRIDSGWVGSLTDVAGVAGLVVNCTGLAARQLVSDTSLTSMRGQLVVVENPGVDWFFQDQAEEGDLTYFLPHGKRVVLGGSAIAAAEHTTVDHTIAAAIVERCARVEPRLRDATVVQNRVGLRPNRPSVRLECEESLGFPVIHNYGHGGSGMTLSWGCAADVLRLARDLLG